MFTAPAPFHHSHPHLPSSRAQAALWLVHSASTSTRPRDPPRRFRFRPFFPPALDPRVLWGAITPPELKITIADLAFVRPGSFYSANRIDGLLVPNQTPVGAVYGMDQTPASKSTVGSVLITSLLPRPQSAWRQCGV
ncbi:hypothetical protein BV22DRAFT_1049734 [Leucogyrophana mollusca]|uniref:Uncharacterized protein n=1 Tax=Leucogyrophana mollusca TaxID=85980 RepID=A0ACB8B6L2_9AGAM|nr:hypothetical protein BV22DRAFT_1049734 [Leucogyrophana mollusca]